jgi:ribulose-phosphate 3-epimerase
MKTTITPTILTNSFLDLQRQVDAVRYSSLVQAVNIDVIDGFFADELTITPLDLTVGEFDPIKLDFHFMTEEPMDFVYECLGIKEYLPIRRMYGQVERMSYQGEFLQEVRANGWEAGLALDLFTPIEAIDEEIWPSLTHLLLLGVEAGAQGQALHPYIFDKLAELRQLPAAARVHILVDGGIKMNNIAEISAAGANEVVVGSALWESDDPLRTLESLYQQMV